MCKIDWENPDNKRGFGDGYHSIYGSEKSIITNEDKENPQYMEGYREGYQAASQSEKAERGNPLDDDC